MNLNGIDISSWNKGIDLSKVSCDFVIVKATQGTGYTNPCFTAQIEQALKLGKLCGIYHYASGQGVKAEVDHFLSRVQKYVGKVILCLDWEYVPNGGENSQFRNPSYAKQFMDEVKKRTGKTMLIYGSKDSCFNIMNWSEVVKAGYFLWGAQYANNNIQYGYNSNPWTSQKPWGAWGNNITIFQYTSKLRLDGWAGTMDGNIGYLTKKRWKEIVKGETAISNDNGEIANRTVLELLEGVMLNKYGSGTTRQDILGSRYEEIQSIIDHIYSANIEDLVTETLAGKYGAGTVREHILGVRYAEVQRQVNLKVLGQKDLDTIAQEVIDGKWGNGEERKKKLRAAGYDSAVVQKRVNHLLG